MCLGSRSKVVDGTIDRIRRFAIALDRENSRSQILNPKGEYLREWGFVNRPYDIFIDDQDTLHIAEGGFINYMMKPEVAAANSNFVNYATGNAASLPMVDESVRNDPGVYPPAAVKAKLFPDLAESEEFTRLLNRSWTRFTTGQ